jgi:hypothetical protein
MNNFYFSKKKNRNQRNINASHPGLGKARLLCILLNNNHPNRDIIEKLLQIVS